MDITAIVVVLAAYALGVFSGVAICYLAMLNRKELQS